MLEVYAMTQSDLTQYTNNDYQISRPTEKIRKLLAGITVFPRIFLSKPIFKRSKTLFNKIISFLYFFKNIFHYHK
jgi:hypothetical protein